MAVPLAGLPARGKGGAACYPFQGYEFDTAVPAVQGSRWPLLGFLVSRKIAVLSLKCGS